MAPHGKSPFARAAVLSTDALLKPKRAAVVVAHPGHELRVFGWAAALKPQVYVLTDGSGRHGVSRLPSTLKVLEGLAARPGDIFGFLNDREAYGALLNHDVSFFLGILDALSASFLDRRIDWVAGDATEGFNPTHDICRMLINAAVAIVCLRTGRELPNYEFCLTEWEQGCRETHDARCRHLRLDDSQLSQKLQAAQGYEELKDEVRQALASRGAEHFRIECLRPVIPRSVTQQSAEKPFYERWGERRVAQREYRSVIRYAEHVAPLQAAIDRHVAESIFRTARVAVSS